MRKRAILLILLIMTPFIVCASVKGDVDGNGSVGATDNLLIKRHMLRYETLTGDMFSRADTDNDGKVGALDNLYVKNVMLYGEGTKNVEIKTFNQQNDAVTAYFNNPSNLKSIYSKYKCKSKSNCDKPREYSTSLKGDVNIYQYDVNKNNKKLIATANVKNIGYYLIPNKTYYLETKKNTSKYEIVKVTGNLRMIGNSVSNFRDLGGWNADGGTIRYKKIYRSASSDEMSATTIGALGIKKILDLRQASEINLNNPTAAVKNIRRVISTKQYNIDADSKTRSAVFSVMNMVVNENRVVSFNCAGGKDRTGTLAYILEGILGVPAKERHEDYELTYFYSPTYTRTYEKYQNLVKAINKYKKTNYEQERFINWFLSGSTNKSKDLKLINEFRAKMIDGTPHKYKLSNGELVLSE